MKNIALFLALLFCVSLEGCLEYDKARLWDVATDSRAFVSEGNAEALPALHVTFPLAHFCESPDSYNDLRIFEERKATVKIADDNTKYRATCKIRNDWLYYPLTDVGVAAHSWNVFDCSIQGLEESYIRSLLDRETFDVKVHFKLFLAELEDFKNSECRNEDDREALQWALENPDEVFPDVPENRRYFAYQVYLTLKNLNELQNKRVTIDTSNQTATEVAFAGDAQALPADNQMVDVPLAENSVTLHQVTPLQTRSLIPTRELKVLEPVKRRIDESPIPKPIPTLESAPETTSTSVTTGTAPDTTPVITLVNNSSDQYTTEEAPTIEGEESDDGSDQNQNEKTPSNEVPDGSAGGDTMTPTEATPTGCSLIL